MQTKRDYLASLTPPLAIPGTRGRFSKAALAELERARKSGVVFSDDDSKAPTPRKPRAVFAEVDEDLVPEDTYVPAPIKSKPVIRDLSQVTGYTDRGDLVAASVCLRCCEHVSRCDCHDGIHASKVVVRWSEESEPYGAPIDIPARV